MKSKKIFIIIIVILVILGIVIIYYNNTKEKTNNEVTKFRNIDDELKNFLQYIAYLNEEKDVNYPEMTKDGIKLTIASYYTKVNDYNEDTGEVSYKRNEIALAYKELFGKELDINTKGVFGLNYNNTTDSFTYEAGGDGYVGTYIIKIEETKCLGDGIYSVTFDYAYPEEADFYNGTVNECDSFRTEVKFRENKNYNYSKYQLVNEEQTSYPLGKIKNWYNITSLELGNYTVREIKFDEGGVSNEECGIELQENNDFKIYMGYGAWHKGKYEIKDNKLICKSTKLEWDGGAGSGSKETDVIFTFDIITDNLLKLSSININDTKNDKLVYEEGLEVGMTYMK